MTSLHQAFIRFLNTVERAVSPGKVAIVDNYAAHKQPEVLKWLADHPRWTFHFTPTSASWLNAVEGIDTETLAGFGLAVMMGNDNDLIRSPPIPA